MDSGDAKPLPAMSLEASLGDGDKSLMVLCTDEIRVALVTTHLPIAKVAAAITKDAIKEKLGIFNLSLKRDFAIDAPRIAVLSLNPHSGENGLLGNEEKDSLLCQNRYRGRAMCAQTAIRR